MSSHLRVLADLVAHDLIATVSTADGIDRLAAAVVNSGAATLECTSRSTPGCIASERRPEEVPALVARIAALAPTLRLDGVFTHLAVADEPQNPYIDAQLEQFDAVLAELAEPSTNWPCTPPTRPPR